MINSFKNYLVEEEKTVYFTFGRMNPPTIGHESLLKKLSEKAGNNPYRVYLSQSQDKVKNPLSYKDKIKFVRKMFPRHARSVMMNPKVKTFLEAASALYDEGYKNLVMIVGSDRINEMDLRLKQYNGVKGRHGFYNFARINVESAGERDPDGDAVSGASATKQRKFAKSNDFTGFAQGLPKDMNNQDAKGIFNAVRSGMGLTETTDFNNHIKLKKVSETREKYVQGDLFKVGDKVKIIESNKVATVKHLGSNYVIIDQDGQSKRMWLEAVKKVPHALNPTLSLKHMMGHAKMRFDKDNDGDVDNLDKYTPDEIAGTEKDITKKMFAKGEKEKQHTKIGKAYEATSAVDLAKKRIDQEKQTDAKRHDRMLDRARLSDTKTINKNTKG